MKMTLLDITQNILSAMNSDEVNTISDTTEARQVAEIIKTTYFNIIARSDLPEHSELFRLDASTADTQPVLMYRPSNVKRIDWIKYNIEDEDNTEPSYRDIHIKSVKDFIDSGYMLNGTDSNVDYFTLNNFKFYYQNDRQPCSCTILQDNFIIFDAFVNTIENTLQSHKTECFGQIVPVFSMEDTFIPDMDDQQFPLLLNEAKALAFMELKQMSHAKAEQESRRQWSNLQRTKNLNKPSDFDALPYFGRK